MKLTLADLSVDLENCFKELSEQSFRKELQLYNRAKYPIDTAEHLYSLLLTKDGFKAYQLALKKAVFGTNYEWLQYLYYFLVRNSIIKRFNNSDVIGQLTGELGLKDLRKTVIASTPELQTNKWQGEFLDRNGNVNLRSLEIVMKKMGEEIYRRFREGIEGLDDGKGGALKESMLADLSDVIMRGMLNGKYTIYKKVKGSDGKVLREKKNNVKIFSVVRDSGSDKVKHKIKMVKVGSEYVAEAFKVTLNIPNEDLNFVQLNLDQETMLKNLHLGISSVLLNPKYSALQLKDGEQLGSKFKGSEFVVQLRAAGITANTKKIDYNRVAEIFLRVVADAIITNKPKDDGVIINESMIMQHQGRLKLLMENDPHLLKELFKTTTLSATSGTMGEILMALFLNSMNDEYTVEVLGQKSTSSGQNAIDIAMYLEEKGKINGLGFQIKSGSTFGLGILMYDFCFNIYNQKTASRYFTDSIYDRLIETLNRLWLYRQYNYVDKTFAFGAGLMPSILLELLRAKPNFLRYGLADLLDEYKELRNNFYVVNFNFIPSSAIFLSFYQSLKNKTDLGSMNGEFAFGYTPYKRRQMHRDVDEDYLLGTWDDAFLDMFGNPKSVNEIADKLAPYLNEEGKVVPGEVPKIWRDSLKLFFSGLQINIKDKLDILIQKAL